MAPGVCGGSPGPRGAGDEPYGGVIYPYVASQHAAAGAPRAAGAGAHRRRSVRLQAPPSCLEGASVRVGPVSAPLAAPLADWGGEPRSAAARCDWTSSAVAERVCGSDVRVRQLLVPVPRECGDTESTHFYRSGASMDAVPLPAEAPHCLLKAGANRLQPVDLPVAEDAGGSP